MTQKFFNLVAFFCCFAVQAHTVWIETNATGKPNKSHEVKIFFGEPDSPTFTEKWFSDIKDLEVKLILPSGKEETLTKTQKESHYVAFFTPSEKGIYRISVKHLVKDVFKDMKITYQSVAFVKVGSNEDNDLILGELPLQFSFNTEAVKVGGIKVFKFLKEGKTAEKERINITSENGWSMSHSTNSKGEIKFKPLWKGKYLVEFSWAKKEEGVHHNKPYKVDYQTTNYLIEVK